MPTIREMLSQADEKTFIDVQVFFNSKKYLNSLGAKDCKATVVDSMDKYYDTLREWMYDVPIIDEHILRDTTMTYQEYLEEYELEDWDDSLEKVNVILIDQEWFTTVVNSSRTFDVEWDLDCDEYPIGATRKDNEITLIYELQGDVKGELTLKFTEIYANYYWAILNLMEKDLDYFYEHSEIALPFNELMDENEEEFVFDTTNKNIIWSE